MEIRGIKVDFELDRPADILRYESAREVYEQKAQQLSVSMPKEEDGLRAYANWCQDIIDIFAEMLDATFGDGIARQLMGDSVSLTELYVLNHELEKAVEASTEKTLVQLNEYLPTPDPEPEAPQNRAQRRAPAAKPRKTTKTPAKNKAAKTTAQGV